MSEQTDAPRQDETLVVYGHDYCTQAWWLKRELAANDVPHEWRDVLRGDPQYQTELRALARGNLSVPTVVFPDGSVLVEPYPNDVLDRLGIERPGLLDRVRHWFGG